MRLEYNISLTALTDSYLICQNEDPSLKKRKRLCQWFFAISCSVISALIIPYLTFSQAIIAASIFLAIVLFMNLFFLDKSREVMLKLSAKVYVKKLATTMTVKQSLEITDDKIILYTPTEIHEVPLENIYKIIVFKENIHILKSHHLIYTIVPFAAFKDDAEKNLFMKMLKKEAIYETKL